jgi:hypothetical protein
MIRTSADTPISALRWERRGGSGDFGSRGRRDKAAVVTRCENQQEEARQHLGSDLGRRGLDGP